MDLHNESEVKGSKLRRAKREHPFGNDDEPDSKRAATENNIPFLPNFLLKSLDNKDKINILKWRKLVNQGRKMQVSDIHSEKSNQEKPPRKFEDKKKGKSLRRQTNVKEKGLPDSSLKLKLKDQVDEGYSNFNFNLARECNLLGYDSNFI